MFIRDNSAWLNIETACIVLGVSKSSYYDWLGNYEIRQAKLSKEQELAHKVIAVVMIPINGYLKPQKARSG